MTAVRRCLASATVAAALLGAATVPAVVLAPVAAAHSVLVSINPEDGADLDVSPGQIEMVFNEEINQSFASVAVTSDENKTNRVVGDPVVEGPTVNVEVEDLTPGAYTVGYRVTSADGHVVSGSSVFTVAGETGASDGGSATAAPDGDDEADISNETSGESTGMNPAIWVVGGLAVVLLGGAVVLLRRGD